MTTTTEARADDFEFWRIPEEECFEIHNRLAIAARLAGLSGHNLDLAVSRAFREMIVVIEREREFADTRARNLTLVESP